MVYKKHIRKNGKKFGPYYYESYRENGKVKTRFVGGPGWRDKVKEWINKNLTLIVMLLILLVFIGLVFFSSRYLSYSIEDKLYTGFLLENYYGGECTSAWTYDLSECMEGYKKKIWIDMNACGGSKPLEKIPCEENIDYVETPENYGLNCSIISECELTYGPLNELGSGIKKMSCEFEGEVISIISVPCEIKKDIIIEGISNDKVAVYNSDGKLAEINLREYKGKYQLDIDWVFN